ncbi:MAG: T9SS type A sorting domain-containing protein, partial [Dysgonamonadaceae bacterium]|nr:T9SS type A sorting domain-containing protein [Dysgonamonadaceae bacterium]
FQLLKWQLFEGRTETGIDNIDSQPVNIFSSNGKIIILSEENGMYWISNLSGRLIASQTFESGTQHIQAEPGMYIVKIRIGYNITVRKIRVI